MAEASRLPSRSQLASNLAATARTPRPRQRRPTHGTVPMLPSRPCSYLSGWDGGPLRVLGLDHGWFGISAADATGAQEIFFIAWACLFLFLVIPCLKLPLVYPLAVALVFVAVSLAAIGAFTASASVFTAAGAVALTSPSSLSTRGLTSSSWLWARRRYPSDAVLVPPADAATLSRAMLTVATDPALRRRLALNGRKVAARYTWEACAQQNRAIYDRLVREHGSVPSDSR